MARSENSMLSHSGSFKTPYEKRLLSKGLSESCPEVVLRESNPMIERLHGDLSEGSDHTKDSTDSVFSEKCCDDENSNCDSVRQRQKPLPVAKPRKLASQPPKVGATSNKPICRALQYALVWYHWAYAYLIWRLSVLKKFFFCPNFV